MGPSTPPQRVSGRFPCTANALVAAVSVGATSPAQSCHTPQAGSRKVKHSRAGSMQHREPSARAARPRHQPHSALGSQAGAVALAGGARQLAVSWEHEPLPPAWLSGVGLWLKRPHAGGQVRRGRVHPCSRRAHGTRGSQSRRHSGWRCFYAGRAGMLAAARPRSGRKPRSAAHGPVAMAQARASSGAGRLARVGGGRPHGGSGGRRSMTRLPCAGPRRTPSHPTQRGPAA